MERNINGEGVFRRRKKGTFALKGEEVCSNSVGGGGFFL